MEWREITGSRWMKLEEGQVFIGRIIEKGDEYIILRDQNGEEFRFGGVVILKALYSIEVGSWVRLTGLGMRVGRGGRRYRDYKVEVREQ